jgi:hypothetical protein
MGNSLEGKIYRDQDVWRNIQKGEKEFWTVQIHTTLRAHSEILEPKIYTRTPKNRQTKVVKLYAWMIDRALRILFCVINPELPVAQVYGLIRSSVEG